MKKALLKAIEGGLKEGEKWQFVTANRYWAVWLDGNGKETTININNYLLDPLFWQALGKSLGWTPVGGTGRSFHDQYGKGGYPSMFDWQIKWHSFIDHLAEGKDANEFFNTLLN